jgi:Ca-activated chloride channel family protein
MHLGVLVRSLGCPALVVLSTAVLVGQASTPVPDQTLTFRSTASLVALNVSVFDRQARYVMGLKPSDFAVFEDGVQQNVEFFETNAVPLDLIVLIDTSSSMSDKLDAIHEAAVGFLNTLREGDRGAVVTFSDNVKVLAPLTTDRAALERAVRSTQAKGSTALNTAVYISLKQFGQLAQHNAEIRRQAIAVLTDGNDTTSMVTFDDVLALARGSGVSLYMVCLQSQYAVQRPGTDPKHRFLSESDYALKTLARETGAQAFFPSEVGQLKGIYASIAAELANQYSIGYEPANISADGGFRRINVRLVSHPELMLRTRPGYTAEAHRAGH